MEENKRDLQQLKEYVTLFLNNGECPDEDGWDAEPLYEYAVALKNGEVEDDPERAVQIFHRLLSGILPQDPEYVFETFPAALEYIPDVADEFPAWLLGAVAQQYENGLHDNEKAFEYYKRGTEAYPDGLCGGMALVSTILYQDQCRLDLARCYMEGIGTEKNYPLAFINYQHYHTDHLAVKHGQDYLDEATLSELYRRMKEESDAGKNYPGLHYALAVMVGDGFGAPYDENQYLVYRDKEMENYTGIPYFEDCPDNDDDYRGRMQQYDDAHYSKRQFESVKSADDTDIDVGDVVRLGKYNHRDVLWFVIEKKDGQALLLSTDSLESSYIVNEKYGQFTDGENGGYKASAVPTFLQIGMNNVFDTVADELPGFDADDRIEITEDGNYLFLLNYDDIERCQLPNEVLLAGAREQAKINGYDSCGVEVDEETGASPWWTSTELEDQNGLLMVSANGEFEVEPAYRGYLGIRPALWLNLKQ